MLLARGGRGYDEELLPVGAEDINIMRRMPALGQVMWFSGEWVGFSLPNVMAIDEARSKAMMDTYKARRSDTPAERGMSIQSTPMQGMTWEQMNKNNLQTTAARCKKGEWQANVTAERIGVDTLEWWGTPRKRRRDGVQSRRGCGRQWRTGGGKKRRSGSRQRRRGSGRK